ncbi:MAG: alpha-L-fucosidase [Bacteroidales bacterium]|nr:alpha-L-fucosidase [Bacteroidales bacterium]
MRNLTIFSLFALLCLPMMCNPVSADVRQKRVFSQTWHDNKYSMFIHFGLYSMLGGVWDGQQVSRGYSEQIQAHAGIYGDVYEKLADKFNPERFDADAIVALAKQAGMRSIVITSKHHDGFCLFHTATTTFNSYDSSVCHRDFIAELSDACHRGGIGFGLYYSLIDWHHPGASSITSHNANVIPEVHHQLNLNQVRELVTNYGTISELWFDMGSLTPRQSKELYDLVHRFQPDCMVSGRLGNGQYDFAMMGDNFYPESSLQTAWQCPASMFNATWGYRSWQERGDAHAKAREKLCSLIRVVAGGGNYLLNIGPTGLGEVVSWEADVLKEIGSWLQQNGDVIYACEGSPYHHPFSWGGITRKDCRMNLILSGVRPESDEIVLPSVGGKLMGVSGPATVVPLKDKLVVRLSPEAYKGDVQVVRLEFDDVVQPEDATLTNTRIAISSYNCQDYYSNERSEVGYCWNIDSKRKGRQAAFLYAASDVGKAVSVVVDGNERCYTLGKTQAQPLRCASVVESNRCWSRVIRHGFAMDKDVEFSSDRQPDGQVVIPWTATADDRVTIEGRPFDTLYMMETVTSACNQDIVLEVGAGNGIDLFVIGHSVMKHLNPYRCVYREEQVLVTLRKGENQIVLRSYNRNERVLNAMIRVASDQTAYRLILNQEDFCQGKLHRISVGRTDCDSRHADCELHNLRLEWE